MVIQATALNRRKQTGDSVISMEREGKALRADRKESQKAKNTYKKPFGLNTASSNESKQAQFH